MIGPFFAAREATPELLARCLQIKQQSEPAIANALAELLATGRDPRLHVVLVTPAAGLAGSPEAPPEREMFVITPMPREALAACFAPRPEIAAEIRAFDPGPGRAFVAVVWRLGTQLFGHELTPSARGGRA